VHIVLLLNAIGLLIENPRDAAAVLQTLYVRLHYRNFIALANGGTNLQAAHAKCAVNRLFLGLVVHTTFYIPTMT
jgi:hypothetical protein